MSRAWLFPLTIAALAVPFTLVAKPKGAPIAGSAPGTLPDDKGPVVLVLDAPHLTQKQFDKLAKCDDSIENIRDDKGLPRNFRSTSEIFWQRDFTGTPPPATGLDALRCSGSAQYSTGEWQAVLDRLQSRGASTITVVDLRQEAHGFVNNMAISWYAYQDSINRGLPVDIVMSRETDRLQALKDADEITISKFTDKSFYDPEDWRVLNLKVDVENVRSEYEVITESGCGYFRIAAPDYMAPEDVDVDRFVTFVRKLDPAIWVHFHCCAGQGRTTTFMVMYDMMRNAKTVSRSDIIRRQYLLGGIDLAAVPTDKAPIKQEWSKVRRDFLGNFYQYCREAGPSFKLSWSKWKAKNTTRPAAGS